MFSVGDVVTCRFPVHAYYSAYGGGPAIVFKPGMRAKVKSITPKVTMTGEPPVHDRKQYMLVCDYLAPETGRTERVSLNFCNAVKV